MQLQLEIKRKLKLLLYLPFIDLFIQATIAIEILRTGRHPVTASKAELRTEESKAKSLPNLFVNFLCFL